MHIRALALKTIKYQSAWGGKFNFKQNGRTIDINISKSRYVTEIKLTQLLNNEIWDFIV